MKFLKTFLVCLPALLFAGCTPIYEVYIRNLSTQSAYLDVFLTDKSKMATLPNQANVANRIVDFKSSFHKYLDSTQNVAWIDTSHFRLEIKPSTTIDLKGIASALMFGPAKGFATIAIPAQNKIDTLPSGDIYAFMGNRFELKPHGISSYILYCYDINQ